MPFGLVKFSLYLNNVSEAASWLPFLYLFAIGLW